jgi:hypothetical protein
VSPPAPFAEGGPARARGVAVAVAGCLPVCGGEESCRVVRPYRCARAEEGCSGDDGGGQEDLLAWCRGLKRAA